MKRFEFSMQKLLDAREAREKGIQMKLAACIRLVSDARLSRKKLSDARTREVEEIIRLKKLSGDGWKVASLVSYLEAIDSELNSCDEIIRKKISERDKIREELTAAVKERKVLEKLSEKEKQQWLHNAKRLEEKMIDESASAGFLRRLHAV